MSRDTTIIRPFDIKRAGHCTRGARKKFADYKLDWKRFKLHGIEAQDLLDTGDAYCIQVVERRAARNDGQEQA